MVLTELFACEFRADAMARAGLLIWPLDLVEQLAQVRRSRGVDHANEFDASFEVLSEAGMRFAVLAFWSMAEAVGEDGLEAVVVGAADVGVMVDDEAGEMLTYCLAHDAGFAMVNAEAFVVHDGGYIRGEAICVEVPCAAGEGEIVGVSGVCCADGLSETEEAAVHMVGTEVSEGG